MWIDEWPDVIRSSPINDIIPDKQLKYFVAVIGTEVLDLIIDLCYPDKPEQASINSIDKLIEQLHSPKRRVADRSPRTMGTKETPRR